MARSPPGPPETATTVTGDATGATGSLPSMSETLARPSPAAGALAADGATAGRPARLGITHVPALDGLRGVAIVGMLLYHANLAKGSWLSLSTFFTLSGFLITGLLVTEHHSTGGTDLGSFWSRRARRLVPGALVALTLTAVLAWVMEWIVASSRADFLSSTFWVANWRFIFADRSYGELFTNPSPVQHFWSLAVEEQFYLVFPLVLVVASRWGRTGIRRALLAMAGLSVVWAALADMTFDRAYYGTDVRAAEFAIGGLLALVLWRDDQPGLLRPHPRTARAVEVAGALALALGAWAWWRIGPDVWWAHEGGLAVYALVVTVPVIAAATLLVGPTPRLLALGPLIWLGTISYGLYLYHWPIFLLLTPERTGLDGWALFAVRVALTAAVAVASFHLVEEPIRRRRRLAEPRPARAAWAVAVAVTVGVTLVVTIDPAPPPIDFDAARAQVAARTPPSTTPAPGVPTIALFGDSTAVTAAVGVLDWAIETGDASFVTGSSQLGCGLGWGGDRRSGAEGGAYPEACPRWDREWAEVVASEHPDVAIVMIGTWDAYDRTVDGVEGWLEAGDPAFDEWYLDHLLGAIDMFNAAGTHPVWLTIPPSLAPDGGDPVAVRGQAGEPERIARLNELIEEAAALRPGEVSVVDWAGWLDASGRDADLRPDGVHLSLDTTREAADWIMPEVVDAWETHERAAGGSGD